MNKFSIMKHDTDQSNERFNAMFCQALARELAELDKPGLYALRFGDMGVEPAPVEYCTAGDELVIYQEYQIDAVVDRPHITSLDLTRDELRTVIATISAMRGKGGVANLIAEEVLNKIGYAVIGISE